MGYYDNVLEHHGILGQKWGVRRFENEEGTLTAAGRKRYDTDENGNYKKVANERKANKAGLSDGQKKAIVVGAAVVGTALAAYGGYKLHQISGIKKAEHAKALMEAAKKQGVNFTEVKKVTPNVTELKKVTVNTVKPNSADKKQADIAKKAAKSMSEGLKSSSPAKFEFEKFIPEKFDFDKIEYANNELVNDLLKKNNMMLGL